MANEKVRVSVEFIETDALGKRRTREVILPDEYEPGDSMWADVSEYFWSNTIFNKRATTKVEIKNVTAL